MAGPPKDALAPVGSAADHFALMLHDRILALEREVGALAPKPMDPRVSLLGTRTQSDSGAVLVRVHSATALKLDAWCQAMLSTLGGTDSSRFDVWCCQHWSLGKEVTPFVTEALVEKWYYPGALSVPSIAHAALDACTAESISGEPGGALHVEACAVTNPHWFAESIRSATEDEGAVLRTWDPRAKRVLSSPCTSETGTATDGELRAWRLLNGWLASRTEVTDVWHPKALSASTAEIELVAALGAVLDVFAAHEHPIPVQPVHPAPQPPHPPPQQP